MSNILSKRGQPERGQSSADVLAAHYGQVVDAGVRNLDSAARNYPSMLRQEDVPQAVQPAPQSESVTFKNPLFPNDNPAVAAARAQVQEAYPQGD